MPYIKEYTRLHPKEQRQLFYKRRYKAAHPAWDDSMVLLTNLLKKQGWGSLPRLLDIGCGPMAISWSMNWATFLKRK